MYQQKHTEQALVRAYQYNFYLFNPLPGEVGGGAQLDLRIFDWRRFATAG